MTRVRYTADTITDDALDALYENANRGWRRGDEWKAKAEAADAEVKRWIAFIERGMDTHMKFSVVKPDGTTEELPCADWCYACRVEKAEAAVERARRLARRWAILRAYGGAAVELRKALADPEESTTP